MTNHPRSDFAKRTRSLKRKDSASRRPSAKTAKGSRKAKPLTVEDFRRCEIMTAEDYAIRITPCEFPVKAAKPRK